MADPTPLNLEELETIALEKLDPLPRDYYRGGSGDEKTLQRNRTDWDTYRLLPHMLTNVAERNASTQILNCKTASPIIIAPTAFHAMAHPDGELATARAAKTKDTIFVVSSLSTKSFEEIGQVGATWWLQLYVNQDIAVTHELIDRAIASGAKAIQLTVDAPLWGTRERDTRNGFHLPPGIEAVNLSRSNKDSDWLQHHGSGLGESFNWMLAPATTWADFAAVCDYSPIPVLAKGVLHPGDAKLAMEHGAAGVVVSNHGGRQLDGASSTALALPDIVEAMDSKGVILVDGGIRRGVDALRALALGAHGVQLGRPILWGLAWNGETGAEWVLEKFQTELDQAMALAGVSKISEIDRSLIATR